ncbi:DUF808 family protein [Erwinia tracheiphila]|uniref:DUF808 family protein n=1 Tax=Erwinia tracheiphila TaxID=65700 RepID=A0A345CQ40_9GAMM|nr:DUF808 family protein [Erwinia tracheiphila]
MLSAEIVAITLCIVSEAPLLNQVLIISGIAILVTIGVYGIVDCIVKIDDLGLWLQQKSSYLVKAVGGGLLSVAPWLVRTLSVVGRLGMFLVGSGMIAHGIPLLHHGMAQFIANDSELIRSFMNDLSSLATGMIVGMIVLLLVKVIAKVREKSV